MINGILKLIDKLLLIYFRKINKNRSDFHEGAMGLTVRRRKRLFFILNRQECEKYLTVKSLSKSFKVFQISLFQLIFTDIWLQKNL